MKRSKAKRNRCLNLPYVREINERGLTLVEQFEGLQLKAYRDEVGVWTIGWGFTGWQHNDGTVYEGLVITRARAVQFLQYNMHQCEGRVDALVNVSLNDDQFSALVSFDFNTGALGKSTLLKELNNGEYSDAADQLLRWVYAGGVKYRGLVRRRESERNLFYGKTPYIVERLGAAKGAKEPRWKNNVTVETGI